MPIHNPQMECLPRAELEQLQIERLQTTLNRVYRHVAFYRESFGKAKLNLERITSLAALRDLPFTTKDDLRRSYPYDMFAVPLRDIVRIHSSSGTTGKPIGMGYTYNDIRNWSELTARVLAAVGIGDHDFVQIAFHELPTGTFGFHYGAERLGASVIPALTPDVHEQLRMMRDYKTTALVSTPGYALRLARTIEEMGIHPAELNLRCALLGGCPWSEELRQEIDGRLQVTAYDNFGLSEVMGPGVSGECQERHGLHVAEDHFIVEVIDPESLDPVAPGAEGELVFTTLTKEGFPLIRYRTGDLASLLPGDCPCGRTFVRMSRVSGRCDDLIVMGEYKFFPDRVAELLAQSDGLDPDCELIVDRDEGRETLEMRVEVAADFPAFDEIKALERLQQELADRVRAALGVRPRVVLVERGALARAGGKRHVVVTDRRR